MILNSITLGLIFSLLGFGIFISFKILSFTDLTAEASFTLGAAVAAVFARSGLPELGLLLGALAGSGTGLITGLLHTKLHIDKVLSGILTLTAFYTINLLVTNFTPNFSLPRGTRTVFFSDNEWARFAIAFAFVIAVAVGLYFFFKTRLGLSIRATGDNETMVVSSGRSTDLRKIMGLMLSNAIIALSGALFMQCQGYYDSTFGTGMMVVGVSCIVIGEIFTFKKHEIALMLLGIVIGSIIYRLIYLGVITASGQPQYMKLFSAAAIVVFIVLSKVDVFGRIKRMVQKRRAA